MISADEKPDRAEQADNENPIIWRASITRWRKFENRLLMSVHNTSPVVNICPGASICRLALHFAEVEFYLIRFSWEKNENWFL
jgi:hypothetical protein